MRLVDSFIPLIGYVVLFRNGVEKNQPPYQQVRGDIQRLLSQSERWLKEDFCSDLDYDLARFIVCAWVDEVLLASAWKERNLWQREQLQRQYYNTTDAGVEAFEKLNLLGLDQREVREVYYVCLSLGFRGRFINPGDDFLLDQLRSSNLKILAGTSPSVLEHGTLFPEAFPEKGPEMPQACRRFTWVTAAALGAPLLLFVLLLLIYRFTLSSVAGRLF
ncbi:DotU family type IV/VI secretion system protein [Geomonas sp. RF6]|uniref:DotU family type IV/VI secretion system protein n=1 Tax=Geomonas sp. RF6 TaxID=2897342 RepID=UPI001E407EA5|nr:DotU family type IV/VI secretion system protein [Geomonas sp. RF6]UFS70723.1 DotU family type IV/VI secretion system protein [Geomonas sp. RF6]